MRVTGKVTWKQYKCSRCGHEQSLSTNHYGEVYDRCPGCSWKNGGQVAPFTCLEPLPEGWGRPEPRKVAKLGDLVEIWGGTARKSVR